MIIDVSELKYFYETYGIQIKTDTGFENVINVIEKEELIYEIRLSNLEIMRVAYNHLFETIEGWKFAKELNEGDKILSEDGIVEVIEVINLNYKDKVFDLTIDSKKHQYYLNGISSHNTGKSSVENIIQKQIKADILWINSSDERGIDTFRYKVQNFASKVPVNGNIRIVILSEADYLTQEASATLRNIIEQYSTNTRFLMTGNYKDKIIPPLLQRLQVFDFDDIFAKNKKELAKEMYKRLEFICQNENIKYTKEDLLKLIKTFYPSLREMIINLQKSVINNELILTNLSYNNSEFDELMELVKTKKFKEVREKLEDITNIDNIYTYLYNNLDKYFDKNNQPSVIVDIATYQDYNYRAKNKKIPAMSLIVKIWNKVKR